MSGSEQENKKKVSGSKQAEKKTHQAKRIDTSPTSPVEAGTKIIPDETKRNETKQNETKRNATNPSFPVSPGR